MSRTDTGKDADRMADRILISVVIPCHNAAGTLRSALDSVRRQRIPLSLIEVLAVDDCSGDNTLDVLEEYAKEWNRDPALPRLRILKNQENLGAAGSRNRAVAAARGAYIAFLDADDWWTDDKLAMQLKRLQTSGAVLCCTGRELLTPEGELTGRVIGVKEKISYRGLLGHNSINCSSVLLRSDVAREFPMEHEDSHEDYIVWLKVLRKYGSAEGIDRPLLKYRLTKRGKSGSKLKSARMTYTAYRYAGFGPVRSGICFVSYALHGVWKYTTAGRRGKSS